MFHRQIFHHALALCCALTLPAQALYVATTGNDLNSGTAGSPLLTISKAIDLGAPGTTIHVAAGAYGAGEQIEFTNKSMTLVGAGIGLTVIEGHATLTKPYPTGAPPGVPDQHRVGIAVNGPARVDVRDLTIDMKFNFAGLGGSGRLYGMLFLNGGDGTVDGVEIRNTRANPIGAAAGTADVLVRGDNLSDPCDVRIRRSHLHDFGKAGCVAAYNSTVTLENDLVVGAGPISTLAQVGVQISFGAKGTLRSNLIQDTYYSLPSYTANGILLYDAAPGCLVESNSTCRAQGGIFAYRSSAGAAAVTIRGNTVTESDFGIAVSQNGSATVVNNVLHGATIATASDDSATNVWTNNNYSDWVGVGPYVVTGGGVVDGSPRRGYDGAGAWYSASTGGASVEIAVADFNGDGKRDFVVVNKPLLPSAQPTLVIGIAGAFPNYTLQTVPFGSPGELPGALAVGEFDGSLGLDVAVVTSTSSGVYVFPNGPPGTFGAPLGGGFALVTGQGPSDLAAGDLNGDGVDDLVVALLGGAPGTGGGRVLINNGNGTAFAQSALPGLANAMCRSVAIGRLDGDGTRDIAILEGTTTTGSVDVFLNVGAGVFPAQAPFSPLAVDADPTSVAIADLDGDGRNDVLVSCTATTVPGNPGSAILMRNVLPALAAFVKDRHVVGPGPTVIVPADFGNDSDPDTLRRDAVVLNSINASVSLLSNLGPATFEANYAAPLTTLSPASLAVGDMNKDGFLDYVVAAPGSLAVIIVLGRPTARNDVYGEGCPGTGGRKPFLEAVGAPAAPFVPNAGFAVAIGNGLASMPCAVILSAGGVPSPFECSFLLTGTEIVLSTATDAVGRSVVPIPIPNNPFLVGGTVYFQGAVVDFGGGFLGLASLTHGLKVRLGY